MFVKYFNHGDVLLCLPLSRLRCLMPGDPSGERSRGTKNSFFSLNVRNEKKIIRYKKRVADFNIIVAVRSAQTYVAYKLKKKKKKK